MRISQIVSIVILTVFTYAQESPPVPSGSEYFRFQPGAKWEMHMIGADGNVNIKTYYEQVDNATENKVAIYSQTEFGAFWSPRSLDIFAITMSGKVVRIASGHEPSTYVRFTPPQTYLPAKLEIGNKWIYAEGDGDSSHCEVIEYLPKVTLPDGQVYSDLVIIKKRKGGGTAYFTTYEYWAPIVGLIGFKQSMEKGWFEYLAK